MMQDQNATDSAEQLQDLHDSEISGSITWLFDNAWHAEGLPADTRTHFQHGSPGHSMATDHGHRALPDSPVSEKYRNVID